MAPLRPYLKRSVVFLRSYYSRIIPGTVLTCLLMLILWQETRRFSREPKGYLNLVNGVNCRPKRALSLVASANRDIVIFVYKDTPNARINLEFFVAHALHDRADFIFVIQGKLGKDYNLPIPVNQNINIIYRNNSCQDLGAYKEVLTKANLYHNYTRFILLNASVRGPFLPLWSNICWSDMLFSLLNDKVKLVGTTFNCIPTRHVQSMMLVTDRTGLELILPVLRCFSDHQDAIANGERQLTNVVLRAGYTVDVLMNAFRADDKPFNCTYNDPNWEGWYFGINVDPYEVIFPKVNRKVQEKLIQRYTDWHNRYNYSSYEFCR